MAAFIYDEWFRVMGAGTSPDLGATTALKFGALLVMTDTTADDEKGKANVGAFTTLDECDSTSYTGAANDGRIDIGTGSSWSSIGSGLGYKHDSSVDLTYTSLTASTRGVQAVVIVCNTTGTALGTSADASLVPVYYLDGVAFTPNGFTVTISFNSSGIATYATA